MNWGEFRHIANMYVLFWHTDNMCIDTIFGTMTTMRFWHIDAIPVIYRKGAW